MIRIVIDERERQSMVPFELERLNATLDYAYLEVGDYIPAPDLIVERKTCNDLVSSIYDGRLFTQCEDMKKHYQKQIVIVEGNELNIENPSIVYGALASIATDLNISVLSTQSPYHTALLLISLAKKREIRHGPLLKKIKKESSLREQQLFILASLPGIGEKLASRLLDKFGTPLKVMNAPVSDLARVENMGYVRASKLKKVLEEFDVNDQEIQIALDNYNDC